LPFLGNKGNGAWSNIRSLHINIQDWPYFDTSYQEPANGAMNVSKAPVLRWRAIDADGDELDYYVCFGTDPNELYDFRLFKSNFEGLNWTDFSIEYHKQLIPNQTYYWQVWVREKGHYSDYYGEYIKSPIWEFTTIQDGSDLAIINVVSKGEILPDSTVHFDVTVKNLGNEIAGTRIINCSYIKDENENPFWTGHGYIQSKLQPGQSEIVDVKVRFRSTPWISGETTYDNVLVSGESFIKFYFQFADEQDVNNNNNQEVYTINYIDLGGPTIQRFEIVERCSMYKTVSCVFDDFWARMGHTLEIKLDAKDDVLIKKLIIQYRYNTSELWAEMYSQDHNSPNFTFSHNNYSSDTYEWLIPSNLEETDSAQIRVLLYDDKNNETIQESELFSIYTWISGLYFDIY